MKYASSIVVGLAVAALLPFAAMAETTDLAPGTLVKAPGSSSVYYIDQDLTRHAFPNVHVFKSWYANFNNVVSVSDSTISQYPLGSNVPYKPAVRLVKIQTDPKVYAVDDGGVLRWIKSEKAARELYGDNWNQMVDDLPDVFFANYTVGQDISGTATYDVKSLKQMIKDILQTLKSERIKKLSLKGASADDLSHKGYGKNKVAVCHNFGKDGEHTIYVAQPAVAAHLKHGDKEGACAADNGGEDETAPVISGAAVSGVTSSGATVSFTTDEDATGSIYYSTSTPVDKATASVVTSSTLEKSHSISLTGLTASTAYHFLIQAVDGSGNVATGTEMSFTTLAPVADTTAPAISAMTVDTITETSAKVHITTDEGTTAKVYFSTSAPVDTATAAHVDVTAAGTSYSVDLTGLASATAYHVVAVVTDAAGNSAASAEHDFTTLTPDTIAPTISTLTVDSITDTAAAVHVVTDENAAVVVYYGTVSPLVLASAAHMDSSGSATSFDADLTGLAASTTYYVVVTATDAAGNVTTSTEQSFTTTSASE